MRSEVRKQDGAGKALAGRMEAECDRMRQMVDALGDQIHIEGVQQRERVEAIVREVAYSQRGKGEREGARVGSREGKDGEKRGKSAKDATSNAIAMDESPEKDASGVTAEDGVS